MQGRQPRFPGRAASALFGLSSEQCELLAAFEAAGSLAELARALGRDVSVASRQLQALARASGVVEKQGGRWRVTPMGARVAQWARDAAAAQARVLARQEELRVVATREFCARVLAPDLGRFVGDERPGALRLLAVESGIERALLDGQAELGFDCGRPVDPAIRFRAVVPEPFAVVAAPSFAAGHRARRAPDLVGLPYLDYVRAPVASLLARDRELPALAAASNDIASVREAALAGVGWAVLPAYAVAREIAAGALVELRGWEIRPERFGVWWLASRSSVDPWVARAVAWLGKRDLRARRRRLRRR